MLTEPARTRVSEPRFLDRKHSDRAKSWSEETPIALRLGGGDSQLGDASAMTLRTGQYDRYEEMAATCPLRSKAVSDDEVSVVN